MKNSVLVDGFLMKAPRDLSKGKQRMARFEIAYHYFSAGGQKQVFVPVICYGKSADYVLDDPDADFRTGDMLQVEGKLKALKYKDGKYDKTALELMGNMVIRLKKGKQHPDGGDEQFIGLPEGV